MGVAGEKFPLTQSGERQVEARITAPSADGEVLLPLFHGDFKFAECKGLVLTRPPDFAFSCTPSSVEVTQGETATTTCIVVVEESSA